MLMPNIFNTKNLFQLIIFLILNFIIFLNLDFFIFFPFGFMGDDSYFYSVIAYNIGVNHFSSFDGINFTNGYHLLWELLLSVISFFVSFFSKSKNIHLFFHISFYMILVFFLLNLFKENYFHKLVVFLAIFSSYILMENLIIIILVSLIYFELKKNNFNKNKVLNFCFFLIPLSRIDSVVIVFLIPIFFFIIEKKIYYLKLYIYLLFGIITHFLLMFFISGEFYSISSYIKLYQNVNSTMPNRIVESPLLSNLFFNDWLSLKLRGYVIIIFFIIFLLQYRKSTVFFKSLYLGLYFYFFMNLFFNFIDTWYYSIMFGCILMLLIDSSKIKNNNFYLLFFSIFLSLIFFGKVYNYSKNFSSSIEYNNEISKITEKLPVNSKIYQYDLSGHLNFFSKVPVINGDGLVNSFEYADLLFNNKLFDYLELNNICYFTDIRLNRFKDRMIILNVLNYKVDYNDLEKVLNGNYLNIYKLKIC